MKCSLIIDGNYLLNKDVFILFGMKSLYSDLLNLLRKDLQTLIKKHSFDSVYFVADSKLRWRQQFYKEYKQNRSADESIDWSWVYTEYNKFKQEIKNIERALRCSLFLIRCFLFFLF